jgi:hypothetical protein
MRTIMPIATPIPLSIAVKTAEANAYMVLS